MAEHIATVSWSRAPDDDFLRGNYSRGHQWRFDGGAVVAASSSPHVVPLPHSVEANVDPEESFVASLSSCHMLFVLSIAAKKQFLIDHYEDNAVGTMALNDDRKMAVTQVTLRPKVTFSGPTRPTLQQLEHLHHLAHQQCFIANSVRTLIKTEIWVFDNDTWRCAQSI